MDTSIVASHELPVNVRWELAYAEGDAQTEDYLNGVNWSVREDYSTDLSDEYDLGPDCDYGADRWMNGGLH